MRRLIVVSNRGPVAYAHAPDGSLVARRGGGGLVSALRGLVGSHEVTWIASALTPADREVAEASGGVAVEERDAAGSPFRLRLVEHDPAVYDRFYNVFANPLLWFVQHQLWPLAERPEIDAGTRLAWEAYQTVNRAFAEAAGAELSRLGPETLVTVHDYQLYTVPRRVRELHPDARISHFTHIPWAGPNAWRVLPDAMRRTIGEGLLGADVVGLQTERDARSFLAYCRELLGSSVDEAEGAVLRAGRTVRVRAYPISIDTDEFDELARSPAVEQAAAELFADPPERVVLRVDRTDPSKNVVRGFHAFDRFLDQQPRWRGRVRMLALLDPSRQEIPEYAEYLGAIQRAAREVGERWADEHGNPAIDLRIHDNFPEVVAAYRCYDVLLVNALYDGMNLVAKEAPLVNARDGVVILSENAGAHAELGRHALSVNPFDVQEQADAIARALEMPLVERSRRATAIREHVRRNDVHRWIERQFDDLDALEAR